MSNEVLRLIPQAPPFVMIDRILQADKTCTRSTLTVRNDNVFVENGFLKEPGLLENIAQTAAAGVGMEAQKENRPAPIGYIGAVKNFEVFELPEVSMILETEIKVSNHILNATIISGEVWSGTALLARCEMKIFIQPEVPSIV